MVSLNFLNCISLVTRCVLYFFFNSEMFWVIAGLTNQWKVLFSEIEYSERRFVTIWYYLYYLKNIKNTQGEVLLSVKFQASAGFKLQLHLKYHFFKIAQIVANWSKPVSLLVTRKIRVTLSWILNYFCNFFLLLSGKPFW